LACIEGKQHKQPFKMGQTRARHIGELLHMDLVGPMETMSLDMKQYFLIIVDDYSRTDWTENLASKLEVVPKVREYIQQLETLYCTKVEGVMVDNGTEFINTELLTFFQNKGIKVFTSIPYTPEQNGVAERHIQTITEGA
jgi:IS30 family transposase